MDTQCKECEQTAQLTNGLCEDCLDNKFCCVDCNEYFDIDDAYEIDGDHYCEDCRNDRFYYCDYCGEWVEDITEIDGNSYCDSCRNGNCCMCEDCDEWVHDDNARSIENDCNCRTVCNYCYDCNYFYCEGCDATYHNDYYSGNNLCENCYDSSNEFLHDYNYKPIPIFYGNKSDLHFGIELELENKCGDIKTAIDNLPDFTYAKADSSLNDGFEIVSYPATWNWLKENKEKWDEVLKFRNKGFLSYQTNTCGMHVHMSKKAFGALHLYKFLKLFFENKELILTISRRKRHHLERYASLETDESLVYKVKKGNDHAKRYTAINLENSDTVEIRIFRGTLSSTGFWRNLEFCKATYDYTKNESTKNISGHNFCRFVKNNQKEYPNLLNFLKEKSICV